MKTFFTTTALIGAMAISTGAHALFGFGEDDCTQKAISLVKEHGPKATSLFAKLEAGGSVSAADLKISEGELSNLQGYVTSGCAKDHLTKALKAGGAAKGLF